MAKLTILEYPDPRLRTRAVPVATVDDRIRRLIDDMLETMYAAPGSVSPRPRSTCTSGPRRRRLQGAGPADGLHQSGGHRARGQDRGEEGCLSVPGIFDKLSTRSARIVVRALGRDGRPFESKPMACSPSASSTKWITWRASCSSTTSRSSSARAFARSSRRSVATGRRPVRGGSLQGSRHLTAGTAGRRAAMIDD